MIKKGLFLCASLIVLMMPTYAKADRYVDIKLNNELIKQTDETGKAYIDSATQLTFVPLRFLSDHLNYQTEWNQQEKFVTITNEKKTILISLDSPFAIVNDNPVILNAPIVLKENKIYVPLRFVSEIMDILTVYDKGIISISAS